MSLLLRTKETRHYYVFERILYRAEMKKLLVFAVLFQVYLVSRCPSGLSAESLLAARAIVQGQVPYRDFFLHIGPLPAYLFAALFSVPLYAWCSLVFIGFNLLTAWGMCLIAGELPAAMFLFITPAYGGNEMYAETIMTTFGVWAFYFAGTDRKWLAALMVILAIATKQTGVIYSLCLI